jgi:hypothetical protein
MNTMSTIEWTDVTWNPVYGWESRQGSSAIQGRLGGPKGAGRSGSRHVSSKSCIWCSFDLSTDPFVIAHTWANMTEAERAAVQLAWRVTRREQVDFEALAVYCLTATATFAESDRLHREAEAAKAAAIAKLNKPTGRPAVEQTSTKPGMDQKFRTYRHPGRHGKPQ